MSVAMNECRWIAAGAALALAALGGCASEGPPPREAMARAHTLVEQADKGNAQRYAAADLQRAHDELAAAERDYNLKKYDEARAAAESAGADADLASARGSAGEAQRAALEVARSNGAVRQEADRAAEASAAAPPPQ